MSGADSERTPAVLAADRLSPATLAAGLTGRRFGRPCEYFPQVASTNDIARARSAAGAPEGLLVICEEQVQGRGRRGRVWTAPPGGAILASLLLRPRTPLPEAVAATMILSLAIRDAARAAGAPAVLKWPNDVLCRERKLAGILCEMGVEGDRLGFIVAGFGLNVDFDPAALGLGAVATSLALETSAPVPGRVVVLDRILRECETRYDRWQRGAYDAIWEEWRAALTTLGREVRVDSGDGHVVVGTARDVDRDGALLVATPAGDQRVVAGTVLFDVPMAARAADPSEPSARETR